MDGRVLRYGPHVLLLAAVLLRSGCRLEVGGPDDDARSVVGAYAGDWSFLVADPGSLVPADGPVESGHVRGIVPCPGELSVNRQSHRSISGTFAIAAQPDSQCWSSRPGFCSAPGTRTFCRPVSGTFAGTVGGTGRTVSVWIRLFVRGQEARPSLAEVIGCPIRAGSETFVGSFRERDLVGADAQVTVDCPASTGLDRVDVSLSLSGQRR
jgi:hypothetical protein